MTFEQAVLLLSLALNLVLVGLLALLGIGFVNFKNKIARSSSLIDQKFADRDRRLDLQDAELNKLRLVINTIDALSGFLYPTPQRGSTSTTLPTKKPSFTVIKPDEDPTKPKQ